jgi:myo-inositol 2-dehydrogenase/D-chiro-inositol 1-dehydrogenase
MAPARFASKPRSDDTKIMNDSMEPNRTRTVNRRQFLQTTSAAVVGGGLLLAAERAAHAAGSDTLKIALIGCGGRGSGAADQALSTEGSVKLVAMGDAFRDRLDTSLATLKGKHKDRVDVSEDNKFIGFDAYKQAIAQADVVILATPPGFRSIHFEEAVRQGKHIFSEKPVATDAPGVRRFLAAAAEAKKKNLKVGIGLQRHHQLPYLETLKRLHDGQIGDIVAMRCYWNDAGVWVHPRQPGQTEMEYQMRNWYYFTWLGGDHILEQHIHNLDVINWVKQGHPVRAHGLGGRQVRIGKEFGQIFDHHAVEFEYADGSRCYSQCQHTGGCWSSVSEAVIGTKGLCDVSGASITGENPWTGPRTRKDPYQQEHDDLFHAIRNDTPYNEAEYGAHSTMTAIMGRMATYGGKLVEWDKAINSEIDLMPERYAWDAMPKPLANADGFYPVAVPGKTRVV